MLAASGGFIVLVTFIVIAVVASLLKKKQELGEWPGESGPRREPPPRPKASNWEEELRRVLGEELMPPIVRPPPPLRPVVRPVPPPIPVAESASDAGHLQVDLTVPEPNVEPVFTPLHGLAEAQQRYEAASNLQARVQHHMADVIRHSECTTQAHRAAPPAETLAAARSLRTPAGARSAIIASIVLGPPRALARAGDS